jgi:hypothetical protein
MVDSGMSLQTTPLLQKRLSGILHGWSDDKSLLATYEGSQPVVRIWSVDSGIQVDQRYFAQEFQDLFDQRLI